ncbi:MAG: hypothetical protein ABW032_06185 [Burkholderiaceae bacterium]
MTNPLSGGFSNLPTDPAALSALSDITEEALSAIEKKALREARAPGVSQYRGTLFGLGTGTLQNRLARQAMLRAQQILHTLQRRRVLLRHNSSRRANNESEADEPTGLESLEDDEVEAVAHDRRDATYQNGARRHPHQPHVDRHGRTTQNRRGNTKRKNGAVGASSDDDDEWSVGGDDDGDEVDELAVDEQSGAFGGGADADSGDDDGDGNDFDETDVAKGGRIRRKGIGIEAVSRSKKAKKKARPRLDVQPGVAFAVALPGAGPIQRLAATLPRDMNPTLRDAKLHDEYARLHRELRERASRDPGLNYAAGVHDIERDWHLMLTDYPTLRPETPEEICNRLRAESQRSGKRPMHDPNLPARTRTYNLLAYLMHLNAQAPADALRRKIKVDTRTSLGNMSRLSELLSKNKSEAAAEAAREK